MSKIMKGIMTGCTAMVATTMLPVAGVVGTITVGGALVSGGVGFIAGAIMDDGKKSDKLSEETDRDVKVKERELTVIDYKVRRALLGEMSCYVKNKDDVVYKMFNYVYSEIELIGHHPNAKLDKKLFDDNMLDVEFRYDNDRSNNEYIKARKEGIEFIIKLMVGHYKVERKNMTDDDKEEISNVIARIKNNF